MNFARIAAAVCVAVFAVPAVCFAAVSEGDVKPTTYVFQPLVTPVDAPYSSSVAALPAAPGREEAGDLAGGAGAGYGGRGSLETVHMRPFSALGISVKLSLSGIGLDVATPLAQKFNLRVGAAFFSYSPSGTTSDNITYSGTLNLRSANASIDWFPFGGSFRLSPGVTLYNGTKLNASAFIAAGQQFDLGDQSYTSGFAGQNPVSGTLDLNFGNRVAPSITTGFGNLVPRKLGKHFSVPFEIGAQFAGAPKFALNLTGIACQVGQPQPLGCAPVNSDPTTQQNIVQEQKDLNSNVSGLKAFPILSIGLGYKF